MTTNKTCRIVARSLEEFLEGYVVVGYVAGSSEPVVLSKAMDPKTAHAINALLMEIMSRGGIPCGEPPKA